MRTRPEMWFRISTFVAPVILALTLVSGCASDGEKKNESESEDSAATTREDAQLKFAQCMRDNGVPMADPEPGGGGLMINSQVDEATVRAAEEACQPLLEDAMPDAGELEMDAEQKEALLAQAQCMRDRGWDVPDPQFGDDGRVQMGMGEGIDPTNPDFQSDQQQCAEESGSGLPSIERAG